MMLLQDLVCFSIYFTNSVGGGGGDGGASKAPEPEPIASTPPASAPAAGGSGELKVVSSPPFADSVSEGDVRFQKGQYHLLSLLQSINDFYHFQFQDFIFCLFTESQHIY